MNMFLVSPDATRDSLKSGQSKGESYARFIRHMRLRCGRMHRKHGAYNATDWRPGTGISCNDHQWPR